MNTTKVRALGLVLLAALTFSGVSALASNVGNVSNNASVKDAASVATVAYRRHRVRRMERYWGSDGRWHRHYIYVYVWG
jgi:hypothetical protein